MPPASTLPALAPPASSPWRVQLRRAAFGPRGTPDLADILPREAANDEVSAARRWPVLHALLRRPGALAGLLLLALVFAVALAAPLLYPGDPLDIVGEPLLRPGQDAAHWLGTDHLGRDLAAGLAHGARVSLLVGFVAAAVGVLVGTLVGSAAGYFGGRVDAVLTWLVEIFQTTPTFLLVIVIVAITHSSLEVIALVIGLTSWDTVARLVRAQVRGLLSSDLVLAARSQGFGHGRIVFREILPNALPPVVVTASVLVAGAILMESALAFLGVGDANQVSWGSMIGAGRDMLRTAWYLTAIPGLALAVTVFSLNLVGDALIEALNPRLRGQVAP
jgi:peptide/nickel transport system permease protein